MLPPLARALWPFYVRFSAPSPAWIDPRDRLCSTAVSALQINLPLAILQMYNNVQLGAAAEFAAGAWSDRKRLKNKGEPKQVRIPSAATCKILTFVGSSVQTAAAC
eukprot:COSAG03_NODE_2272_length_2929_cov_3.107067_5_plen_106_part_00